MKTSDGKAVEGEIIRRRTFISFGAFAAFFAAGFEGWRWLYNAPEEKSGVTAGAREPLRRALNRSELFFRRLLFNESHLVKTYPKTMAAKAVRHNSDIGSSGMPSPDWQLRVMREDGSTLQIGLEQIRQIPKTELVFDFKCVEGWDQIQYWGGARMSDFIRHFGLQQEARMGYMGLETPDKQYYVGLDMASALHPQTLLAYEMNGEPLPPNHGKPLRLIIPVKYGIKNLKRIGFMTFSNTRPRDYWAEQGYDYYSGL